MDRHDAIAPGPDDRLDELTVRILVSAIGQLRQRGDVEGADMRSILETQRARIQQTQVKKNKELQQPGLFDHDERKQVEADKRHWERRLTELAKELDSEPARIRQSYEVRASRFEPVGLVYLWPVTG